MDDSPDDRFAFRHPVSVRFRDVDVGGHAHHSLALIYFEEARAAYWREVVGRRGLQDIDYILAGAEVRYHSRVLWPGALSVAVRVSAMGRKHFEMEYRILGEDGGELVTGRTTQVMYDYGAGASKPVPPEVRKAVEGLEGELPRRSGRGR